MAKPTSVPIKRAHTGKKSTRIVDAVQPPADVQENKIEDDVSPRGPELTKTAGNGGCTTLSGRSIFRSSSGRSRIPAFQGSTEVASPKNPEDRRRAG